MESTRQRVESPQSKKTRRSHCGQRFHYDDPLQFGAQILLPQAIKIPDAKAAVDKEWKKLETSPAWQLESQKVFFEVILEAQRDKKKVHFATLMDMCHLKKCGVGTQITQVRRQSRAPGRHCERRLWSLCSVC